MESLPSAKARWAGGQKGIAKDIACIYSIVYPQSGKDSSRVKV